jgi:RimJ/RimL family protein N-acetyltransferase
MALASLNQHPASTARGAAPGLGASLRVREWHKRKDRRAIASWPASAIPATWQAIEPSRGPRISYAVELLPEPHLIGRITLRDIQASTAQLGIYLHPSYVGQGYGTAALRLFLPSIFEAGELAAIRLDVAVDNRRAIRCYEKCGFRVVGAVERGDVRLWEMECSRA